MYATSLYTLLEFAYKYVLRVWQIPVSLHIVYKHKHTRGFIKLLV